MSNLVERYIQLGKLLAKGGEELKKLEGVEKGKLREELLTGLRVFKTFMRELYRSGADHDLAQVPVSILPLDPLFRTRLITLGITNLQILRMIENGELRMIAPGGSDSTNYPFDSGRNREALASIGITLR